MMSLAVIMFSCSGSPAAPLNFFVPPLPKDVDVDAQLISGLLECPKASFEFHLSNFEFACNGISYFIWR